MLVAPDGSIAGTVGGGPLEAVVIEEALQLLRGEGGSCERRFALTAAGDAAEPLPPRPPPGEDLGMKCGGEGSVFLDVVRPRRASCSTARATWASGGLPSPPPPAFPPRWSTIARNSRLASAFRWRRRSAAPTSPPIRWAD